MTELKDIAKENDVDLENCVVFVRGNDDILAVDISNAGIRQRSDDTMGFTNRLQAGILSRIITNDQGNQ